MDVIRSVDTWYPSFPLMGEPVSVPCTLSIVAANGRRYLRTPFAFLDAHAEDELERAVDGRTYFATQAECVAYLAAEYPHWKLAAPIMDALWTARRNHGDIVGPNRVADKLGVSVLGNDLYLIARGQRRFGRKQIRDYTARLAS